MKIVVRTDASTFIGGGHVMRCVALGDFLRENGARVEFVCRELPGNLIGRIEQAGFHAHTLPAPHLTKTRHGEQEPAHWLGVDWREDALETQTILEAAGAVDWLIVDHYGLDSGWESMLRPLAGRILVIDDLADRNHDCDLLLDQSLHVHAAQQYIRRIPRSCRRLLGPRYALLRSEFVQHRKVLRERGGCIHRLLVFFGSGDRDNYTRLALEALILLEHFDFRVDVVIGGANPHRMEIEDLCSRLPKARLHVDTQSMAALMAAADIALGAGGTSTWERACLRLPSIVLAVVKNQWEQTAAMADQGALVQLPLDGVGPSIIADTISALVAHPEQLRQMAKISGDLVDGRGAERVGRELLARSLQLRPATTDDLHNLHCWRNAEEVRRFSKDPKPIALAEHECWLSRVLADEHRDLLIAMEAGQAVGVLRYDRSDREAVVSIYLVPGKSGQGLGPRILLEGDRWLSRHHPETTLIHAEVLLENTVSMRAFVEAGYKPGPKNTFQKWIQT